MEISYTLNTLEYINERETLTKKYFKAFFMKVLFFFLIGLSLLIYGIYSYDDYSQIMTSTHERFDSKVEVHNTYTNWHVAQSVGILIIIITLYLFSTNRLLKKHSQETLSEEISELQNSDGIVEVKINEKFISVKKPFVFIEIHWHLFRKYKDYGDFILLQSTRNGVAIVINKKKLSNSELQNIAEQFQKHKIKT